MFRPCCVLYKDTLRSVFSNLAAAEEALIRMRGLYRKKKQKHLVVRSFFLRESAHDVNPHGLFLDYGCLYVNANLETLNDEGRLTPDTNPVTLNWGGGKEILI